MQRYIEKVEPMTLPVLILDSITVFPLIPISFEVSSEAAISACERAEAADGMLFAVQRRPIESEEQLESVKDAPGGETEGDDASSIISQVFSVGTVAKIRQSVKLPEGTLRVFLEGTSRATLSRCYDTASGLVADVIAKTIRVEDNGGIKGEALIHEINTAFDEFVKFLPRLSNELITAVKSIRNPGLLADFVASNVLINPLDKQQVLEEFNPLRRLELLAVIMERERDILSTELDIHRRVRRQIESNQREYYLKEQLKAIKNELGYTDDEDDEIDEYYQKIEAAKLPKEINEKLVREVKKLAKTPYNSAEASVLRNYLDLCLELPWTKLSKERANVAAARKVLERDHDGLEKVKERILEYIAVKQLNPELRNQILCLVGPPGTGKTSIAASIAKATGRKYVRVSLGGIRDEADIRGHRKTYVGAMPGRIINALRQAGTRNPLILLDEIDKLTRDAHGDPASALLEVLDAEQNKAFRDHFVEMPMDLSDCLFIATANTLSTIPRPLVDRMEVIELQTYTRHEKLGIAKNHLIPKQLKRHGLNKRMLRISDDAILEVIDFYTQEAGVRNLEREIAKLCRKAAMEIVETGAKSVKITAEEISKYLGVRKVRPETVIANDAIGVVNGLAYTEMGGELLRVEAVSMPGTGKLELTGSLGDVMKESARAAVSYIRANSEALGVDADFYKTRDIHIHVPEGAIPKDGPSAGITIATALVSELSGIPVRRDVAMTGEITLRGHVLPIGGLREKSMAAYKAGVTEVCIPEDNTRDLEDIDPTVREAIKFVHCREISEVLKTALVRRDNQDAQP